MKPSTPKKLGRWHCQHNVPRESWDRFSTAQSGCSKSASIRLASVFPRQEGLGKDFFAIKWVFRLHEVTNNKCPRNIQKREGRETQHVREREGGCREVRRRLGFCKIKMNWLYFC